MIAVSFKYENGLGKRVFGWLDVLHKHLILKVKTPIDDP
jgi:hypothetical protein